MDDVDGGFMTATDAWIWYLEGDPRMRWTIAAVMMLDRAPSWERLRKRFERMTVVDPRFRQKVVDPPLRSAPPRWTRDPWFDLEYHLRRVTVPAPGTLTQVLELAEHSAMSGLDRARPLWQATLMEGLEGERAALFIKLHHALTDGIGGMQLALHLVDPTPDEDPPEVVAPDAARAPTDLWREVGQHHVDRLRHFVSGMAHAAVPAITRAATHPFGLAHDAAALTSSVVRSVRPVSDTLSPVMTERGLSWRYVAIDVPFDELRLAAKAHGCTLNDAFVAGITGGLRRYHELHGAPVDELRMSMPISLRNDGDAEGGNHVTVMRFKVPVGLAEPAERMAQVHSAARAARDEPAVPHFDTIAAALSPLTPAAVVPMAMHMDFAASNVPGYRFPVHLCGAEVQRVYPFGPTGGSSANVTMVTYRDTCCLGVNSDPAAIPDGDAFHRCLAEGFDEVLDLGGPHRPAVVAS